MIGVGLGRANPCILVASDKSTDALLVKKLLGDRFGDIELSTVADKAAEDFDREPPDVLVLAFDALEKAERFYLGLYRLSTHIHVKTHRTIILCHKDEVNKACELCMQQTFDDDGLFWPMNHDAPRLSMAVRAAIRQANAELSARPSAAELAEQASTLAALAASLDVQLARGGRRIDGAARAVAEADSRIGAALNGLSHRLSSGALADVVEVRDAAGLGQEIARMKRDEIDAPLHAAAERVKPLKRWLDEFREGSAPQLQAALAMTAVAARVKRTILIVDDDDFQCKLIRHLLEAQNYQVECAESGLAALRALRRTRPDAILMDIEMPGMDGVEVLRRLKAMPLHATIPVIMLTGKSAGNAVMESIKAGASDFIVKPFERETLLAKLARAIGTHPPGPKAPD